jgi:hypothetical protein
VLQPALNGLLDDFIDTSVRASEAWRNFAESILNSLAQILMEFAKNEALRLIFDRSGKKGVDINGKTEQKSVKGVDWGDLISEVTQQFSSQKRTSARREASPLGVLGVAPSHGGYPISDSFKKKQKSGLDWGQALGIGAGAAASAASKQPAASGGGFDWTQALGTVASVIPLFFSEGGDTQAMIIPYASHGLDTKDIALAKGINEAIRKENHPDAFPAVLHKGEIVHSDLTGDAQLARRLKNSGEWDRMKNGG